ncbi:MAG: hypothetical protein PHE29_05755 [Tissierellia bacterium]|nr:hypothetical protein [Tissierellia bacterium]
MPQNGPPSAERRTKRFKNGSVNKIQQSSFTAFCKKHVKVLAAVVVVVELVGNLRKSNTL